MSIQMDFDNLSDQDLHLLEAFPRLLEAADNILKQLARGDCETWSKDDYKIWLQAVDELYEAVANVKGDSHV